MTLLFFVNIFFGLFKSNCNKIFNQRAKSMINKIKRKCESCACREYMWEKEQLESAEESQVGVVSSLHESNLGGARSFLFFSVFFICVRCLSIPGHLIFVIKERYTRALQITHRFLFCFCFTIIRTWVMFGNWGA